LKLDTSLFLCHPTALLSLDDGRGSLAPLPTLLASAPFALVRAQARRPTLLACAPSALMGTDARPSALLASASYALVRTDARPSALLAFAPSALMGADARPPALLASAPLALMGAETRSPALLACAPSALVGADARSPALLAFAPSALVLADARAPALLAYAPLALVRTLRGLLLCRPATLLLAFPPIACVQARVFLLGGTVARLRQPSTTPLLLPLCRPAFLLRLDWRGSRPLRSTTHFAALCFFVRALLVLFDAAFLRYYHPEGAVPMAEFLPHSSQSPRSIGALRLERRGHCRQAVRFAHSSPALRRKLQHLLLVEPA
jgi:hypothetical protein